jgi:hypothetical protein
MQSARSCDHCLPPAPGTGQPGQNAQLHYKLAIPALLIALVLLGLLAANTLPCCSDLHQFSVKACVYTCSTGQPAVLTCHPPTFCFPLRPWLSNRTLTLRPSLHSGMPVRKVRILSTPTTCECSQSVPIQPAVNCCSAAQRYWERMSGNCPPGIG